ncbi:DUF4116 domain-containing protein [Mycoplasmopsis cynos]|uniref:DUF4116 domain-containing protein n=1 Tax=Mycoplasmopsis cynos TaxID=171284 RepID=UPI002AFF02D5|nr:DUF4116 domain-containing protein [Mycoplasmopsis cynos]WQQ15685.1 DUF4116 domain-containing protein [Mycoplasmopsis cynos]
MNKIKKVLVLSSLSAILPFTIVSCTNGTNNGNDQKNTNKGKIKPENKEIQNAQDKNENINGQKPSDTPSADTKLKKDKNLNDKTNNIKNNKQEDNVDIIDSKKLDEKTIKSIENQYLDLIENKAIDESFFIESSLEVIKKLNVKNYKKFVLEAVKRYGWALRLASKELWSDKKFVLEAVKQNGYALEYASEELKKDRDIVLEAVKRDGHALQYASKELQNDKAVVLEAVKQDYRALEYASKELREDKKFISEIIKINPYIILSFINDIRIPGKIQLDSSLLNILYSYKTLNFIDFNYTTANISEYKEKNQNKINLSSLLEKVAAHTPGRTYKYEDLKNLIDKSNEDKQNLISILVKEPDLLKYIPYQFSNDKEFISLIAKQNKDIIKFASRRLQYDEEFINSIKNN